MTTKRFGLTGERTEKRQGKSYSFRNIAAHHAIQTMKEEPAQIGIASELVPERKRLLELAVTEAEALACETGVPELVMLTLAEEKVRLTQKWLARQEQFKNRSPQWQLAA